MSETLVAETTARTSPSRTKSSTKSLSPAASAERAASVARASCLTAVMAVMLIDLLSSNASGGWGWLFWTTAVVYIAGTSALSIWRPAPERLQIQLLVADVLVVTGVIYFSGGVQSNFFPLYYLPILQAAVRLNMRHAIGVSVLIAGLYAVLGFCSDIHVQIPTTVYMRVLSFGGSALFMAAGFALLMTEVQRYRHRSLTMAHLIAELEDKTAALERLNRELLDKNVELEQKTTELTETQSKLLAAEKLASVGQLAAGVGHELRNPLGVIRNCLYYLRTKLGEQDGRTAELLDLTDAKIAESDAIVADLLDFSRGKPPTPVPTDLGQTLDAALGAVEKPAGIELVREIEPLPEQLLDGPQLERAFRNVITNAYQAMGESGTLTVRATAGPSETVIEFSDTGPGIEEANLERIFEPLFTTKAKGIGLGLVLCRKIVEQNGGSIHAASIPGRGAVFTLRFPRQTSEERGKRDGDGG